MGRPCPLFASTPFLALVIVAPFSVLYNNSKFCVALIITCLRPISSVESAHMYSRLRLTTTLHMDVVPAKSCIREQVKDILTLAAPLPLRNGHHWFCGFVTASTFGSTIHTHTHEVNLSPCNCVGERVPLTVLTNYNFYTWSIAAAFS